MIEDLMDIKGGSLNLTLKICNNFEFHALLNKCGFLCESLNVMGQKKERR